MVPLFPRAVQVLRAQARACGLPLLEVDLFGNVNSTHVMGNSLMNGIGGSGDFTRNAHVSIYTCPSVAKGGKISTIVPFVTHLDHSEHSVQVVVTPNDTYRQPFRFGETVEEVSRFLDHSSLAVTTTYLRRLEGQEDRSWEKVAEAIGI